MIYIQLFLSFLQVGALSFGGGYAAMPLIQEQVVNLHSWQITKHLLIKLYLLQVGLQCRNMLKKIMTYL